MRLTGPDFRLAIYTGVHGTYILNGGCLEQIKTPRVPFTSRYLLISFSPLVTTLYLCVRASSLRVEGASRHVLETIACSPSRATCIATFCNWHISDPNATFYWPLSKQQMHSHLVTFVSLLIMASHRANLVFIAPTPFSTAPTGPPMDLLISSLGILRSCCQEPVSPAIGQCVETVPWSRQRKGRPTCRRVATGTIDPLSELYTDDSARRITNQSITNWERSISGWLRNRHWMPSALAIRPCVAPGFADKSSGRHILFLNTAGRHAQFRARHISTQYTPQSTCPMELVRRHGSRDSCHLNELIALHKLAANYPPHPYPHFPQLDPKQTNTHPKSNRQLCLSILLSPRPVPGTYSATALSWAPNSSRYMCPSRPEHFAGRH